MSTIYARLPVSGHYLRKRLRLAGFARRLAGFSLLLVAAAVIFYRLGSILPQALIGTLMLAALLAFAALCLSFGGLVRAWFQGVEGGGKAFGALLLSLVVLTPFALAGFLAQTAPRANVAYTTGLAPDEIGAVLSASGTAAPSTTGAAFDRLPSVVPGRRYLASAPQVLKATRLVLADFGWPVSNVVVGDPNAASNRGPAPGDLGVSGSVTTPLPMFRDDALSEEDGEAPLQEADQYRVETVARDLVFALPSDVVVRMTEDGGETFVELESRSRAIGLDLGQNRRFIESFLVSLDTAMSGLESVNASD